MKCFAGSSLRGGTGARTPTRERVGAGLISGTSREGGIHQDSRQDDTRRHLHPAASKAASSEAHRTSRKPGRKCAWLRGVSRAGRNREHKGMRVEVQLSA